MSGHSVVVLKGGGRGEGEGGIRKGKGGRGGGGRRGSGSRDSLTLQSPHPASPEPECLKGMMHTQSQESILTHPYFHTPRREPLQLSLTPAVLSPREAPLMGTHPRQSEGLMGSRGPDLLF